MTVATQKGAKGKADRLFSLIIRSRGECVLCGVHSGLQCAHIIGRTFSWTRTCEDNAWCLCGGCHYAVDNYADEKMGLVRLTIGEKRYYELRAQAARRDKFDWPAEAARLDAIWKQMKVA